MDRNPWSNQISRSDEFVRPGRNLQAIAPYHFTLLLYRTLTKYCCFPCFFICDIWSSSFLFYHVYLLTVISKYALGEQIEVFREQTREDFFSNNAQHPTTTYSPLGSYPQNSRSLAPIISERSSANIEPTQWFVGRFAPWNGFWRNWCQTDNQLFIRNWPNSRLHSADEISPEPFHQFRTRRINEAQLTAQLDGPHVCGVPYLSRI